ncbi:DUF1428 domain-containing protein [Sphingobium abikonense]|uniref:DUF1428 domain-containing protein n=1 Tax=Sphingobium abikonense TaxID=86193 RepID=UPI002E82ACEC|nr:DUF1428 domain-containing protein [Pseudomonadota bacterium]
MTYVNSFVIAVPEGGKQAYIDTAEKFWALVKEFGALGQVECWEADVKDGHTTDFRMATKAKPGEKIVFSWITWPNKAAADRGEKRMMEDPRMEEFGEMPFDGKRMIYGGFETIVDKRA